MKKNLFQSQHLSLTTASIALIALGNVTPAQAAALYAIAELPFQPADINDRGQIVGDQFLSEAGNITDLRTLPGANDSSISARAINNEGFVVGTRNNQAFLFDGNSLSEVARTPAGNSFSTPTSAFGINDAGQIAFNHELGGFMFTVDVYLRDNSGSTTRVLSDASGSAINNNGDVLGSAPARGRRGPGIGVLYSEGTTTNLISSGYCNPFFTNPSCFSPSIVATDINNLGQVIGRGPVGEPSSNAPVHALLWTDPKNDRVGTGLGTLGEGSSQANGINDLAQIVGTSSLANSTSQRAFLWEEGTILDLNSLLADSTGWELTSALEINNLGQIVGSGLLNGEQRGFVLTPVPEPSSTLGLLGVAAMGFATWLKRQQEK